MALTQGIILAVVCIVAVAAGPGGYQIFTKCAKDNNITDAKSAIMGVMVNKKVDPNHGCFYLCIQNGWGMWKGDKLEMPQDKKKNAQKVEQFKSCYEKTNDPDECKRATKVFECMIAAGIQGS